MFLYRDTRKFTLVKCPLRLVHLFFRVLPHLRYDDIIKNAFLYFANFTILNYWLKSKKLSTHTEKMVNTVHSRLPGHRRTGTPSYRDTFPEIWFHPTQMPPSYRDKSRLPGRQILPEFLVCIDLCF